jgi:hypothetical protein
MMEHPEPEIMLLQARAPEGGEWVNIFPEQLHGLAKDGCDVRALDAATIEAANANASYEALSEHDGDCTMHSGLACDCGAANFADKFKGWSGKKFDEAKTRNNESGEKK